MIHARRTAFTEQPDGSLVCTITIPAAERLDALGGHPVYLSERPMADGDESWGVAVQREVAQATFKAHGASPKAAADEPYVVEMEAAESAPYGKPETQTIGAGGFDTAQVVEAVASGEYEWEHPAAPHMSTIFRHGPFQRFAMYRLHADKFAAPMECATRLITRAVKNKPMDAAVADLTARMNEYMAWATSNNLPLWPERRGSE